MGGVLGGLALISLLAFFLIRRRRKADQASEKFHQINSSSRADAETPQPPEPAQLNAYAMDLPSPHQCDSKVWRIYSGLTTDDEAAPSSSQPASSLQRAHSPSQLSSEAKRGSGAGVPIASKSSGATSSVERADEDGSNNAFELVNLTKQLIDLKIKSR